MVFGLILIAIGFIFLLQNLNIISGKAWEVIWPVVVILLGVGFLVRQFKSRQEHRGERKQWQSRVHFGDHNSEENR